MVRYAIDANLLTLWHTCVYSKWRDLCEKTVLSCLFSVTFVVPRSRGTGLGQLGQVLLGMDVNDWKQWCYMKTVGGCPTRGAKIGSLDASKTARSITVAFLPWTLVK